MTVTDAAEETAAVNLSALRTHFSANETGKLPKINCPSCAKGNCGTHKKAWCDTCRAEITTKHIHIEYVGHADVTARLLDVDPHWTWQPKATDPDPDTLKAAVASGNPDVLQAVLDNAPPRFERNANGYPVGFWILLTIGGVTRLGYGSVPASQFDAEKVLIGDALRNAAMRFGVALDLWAKGDRADPTAENSTGSTHAEPHPMPRQRGTVTRPAQPPAPAQDPASGIIGDWQPLIDGVTCRADADKVKTQLDDAHRNKEISAARASVILRALRAKVATLPPEDGEGL